MVEDKKLVDLFEEKNSTDLVKAVDLVEEKKSVDLVEVKSGRGKNRSDK